MTQRTRLPETASVAETMKGARLNAPSAIRNVDAISDVLTRFAPASGRALEIASGTGQHVARFARVLPGLTWQPSDVDAARRASTDAWTHGLGNVRPACHLDATAPGWAVSLPRQNVIFLANLLHLISTAEARILIHESAKALAPAGRVIFYGPFLREGAAISDADARFDASLRASDPEIGYKDLGDVGQWLAEAGLRPVATVDMPANNLTLISERPEEAR